MAVQVAPAHALVHRVLQGAAGEVAVLAPVQEHHRHARVLTDGQAPALGEFVVLHQIAQDSPAHRGGLGVPRGADGAAQVLGEDGVGLHAQRPDGAGQGFRLNFPYHVR